MSQYPFIHMDEVRESGTKLLVYENIAMAKLSECKASTGHQLATSKDVYCALIFMLKKSLKKCTLKAIIMNKSIKQIHKDIHQDSK